MFTIGTTGLRGAIRAIASLGCEGAMRAIASSMSPHVSPRQGPTPIFCRNRRRHNNYFKPATAPAPPRRHYQQPPTSERYIAARVKGWCTEKAIFTLLRCTTNVVFFPCCDSVAAHFKHASTRQPVVPQAQASC
jgi:hypothetical protein